MLEIKKPKFIETYLNFASTSRFFTTPFSWLYVIMAVAYVALPILILVMGIDFGIFRIGGRIAFAFVLTVIAAFAAAFVTFYVAWDGRKNLSTDKLTSEFVVDSIGEFIQVNFKAFAHFFAIFGFFAGLFALIFGSELLYSIGLGEFAYLGAAGSIIVMIGSLVLGYGLIWFSKLVKYLFVLIMNKVVVRLFKFLVFYVISTIYNFIAHAVKQLFDYSFIVWRGFIDFMVNGFRVVVALIARLGRFLLAYSASPFQNKNLNTTVTYNE